MQKWVSTAPLNSLDGRIWMGHRPPPTGLTVQGSFPVSTWPSSFWYWLDESISTYNAFASLSSLYTKWAGKKEMLVKTNLYLAFSIYGTISVTCQSLGCKIAPPTRDPHFPMTPACQSFMKSKPNFMPSKDQFVNHFACHTSTRITWQLQPSTLKWIWVRLSVFVSPNWVPFRTGSLATNKLFSVTTGLNFIAFLTIATC